MIDFKPATATDDLKASRPRSRRLSWLAGISLVALVAAGAAYKLAPGLAGPTAGPAAAAAPGPVPVSVAVVEQKDTAIWSDFSGRVEAVGRVEVRPRAAGAILKAHFREGALVRQGDLLFTIDPAPYAAEVQGAEAQVASAQARLALGAKELQRAQQLVGNGFTPQRDVDQRVNELRAAEANLRAMQAALDTARLNLGYTEVRAPIAGRAGRIEVTAGNLVPAGPTAPVLTTLVSVNPIYASFEADEQSLARALASLPGGSFPRGGTDITDELAGIPVQMGTLGSAGTPFLGKLQLVDNVVDARSGTVRVRAAFDNPDGKLMPGQFARLRLGLAHTEPALAIDERAIGTDQDRRFVMVVGDDNKVAYRQVALGPTAEGLRLVTSGLKPGERIVVNGLQRIRPGATVAPEPVAMTASASLAAR
ncbi:MAG TPA: efflux RND transporter periplasmic adaptor subunit [Acetobacteraceae bacterium]